MNKKEELKARPILGFFPKTEIELIVNPVVVTINAISRIFSSIMYECHLRFI